MRRAARSTSRAHRRLAATVLGAVLVLSGCVVWDDIRNSATGQRIGIAIPAPCDVSNYEAERLIGAYLRRSTVAPGFELLSITGAARWSGLPKNLAFDDSALRRIADREDILKGSRSSEAVPRTRFPDYPALPAVYDLTYEGDEQAYAGPLVIGRSTAHFELPSTGRAQYTGPIDITFEAVDDDGVLRTVSAQGRFVAELGYGSNAGRFRIGGLTPQSGAGLPFDSLTWANLGFCGTRVISTGQGVVRFLGEGGVRVRPFAQGRDVSALRSNFEGMLFSGETRPAPPVAFGGIFSVESDIGAITGVFLSEGSP